MARGAILVLIAVVALLLWRDVVVEGRLRELAYRDAYADAHDRAQLAARDEVIDDALWSLAFGDGARAVARVQEASRMPAPTAMPERAWHIAAAGSCASDPPERAQYVGFRRDDTRVIKFCALNKRDGAPVKK
jgi:hypothetical protein